MSLKKNIFFSHFIGGIIYAIGDSIASLLSGEFNLIRAISIFIVGASLYAFEIQRYFKWIEFFVIRFENSKQKWIKAMMALVYFNPLWIARHLCIIYLASGKIAQVNIHLLKIALYSFLINIPISIIANYLIQNKISLQNQFLASALFSGLMAIFYSMSSQWF